MRLSKIISLCLDNFVSAGFDVHCRVAGVDHRRIKNVELRIQKTNNSYALTILPLPDFTSAVALRESTIAEY